MVISFLIVVSASFSELALPGVELYYTAIFVDF